MKNINDFKHFLTNCQKCKTDYKKLTTGGNDPKITNSAVYANRVNHNKPSTIIKFRPFHAYIDNVFFTNITSTSVTIDYTGTYSYVRIASENLTKALIDYAASNYVIDNLVPNTRYSFKVYPYDTDNVTTEQQPYSVTTLGEIVTTFIGQTSPSTIFIRFDGSYNTVDILHSDDSIIARDVSSSYYMIGNLLAGKEYNFKILPYNSEKVPGVPKNTPTAHTLPYLFDVSLSNVSPYSITLKFTGIFTSVSLHRSDGAYFNNITSNYYSDFYNIISNKLYSYIVIPFYDGNIGNQLTINNIYALPVLENVSYSDISSNAITLNLSGSYSYVNIKRADNSMNNTVYTKQYVDTNLRSDSSYNYIITPYNVVNLPGYPYYTSQIYTLASYNYVRYNNITEKSFEIDLSGSFTFYTFQNGTIPITQRIGDLFYGDIYSRHFNRNYLFDQLPSNTMHKYTVFIYNNQSILSFIIELTYISTLAVINSIEIDNIQTNSMTLNITGTYSYIDVMRINGNFLEPSYTFSIFDNCGNYGLLTGDSYMDTYNLTSNTSYNYVITPYNQQNISSPATVVRSGYIYTLPEIAYGYFEKSTTNSATIVFDGYYNTVDVTAVFNGRPLHTNSDVLFSPFIDISLASNSEYSYYLIPYNGSKKPGNRFFILDSIFTLAKINNYIFDLSSISNNFMTIDVCGNYYNIDISRNDGAYYSYIYTNTFKDMSGIISNTSYNYTIIPKNINDVIGDAYTGISRFSLGEIKNITFPKININTITVSITGYFSYITLYRINLNNNNYLVKYASGKSISSFVSTKDIYMLGPVDISGNIVDVGIDISPLYGLQTIIYNDVFNIVPNNPYAYIASTTNNNGILSDIYDLNVYTYSGATIDSIAIMNTTYNSISIVLKGSLNSIFINRQIVLEQIDAYGNKYSTMMFDTSFNTSAGLYVTDNYNIKPNTLYNYIINPVNTNGIINFDAQYTLTELAHTYPVITSCIHNYYTDASGNIYLQLIITGNYDQVDVRRTSMDDGSNIDDIIIFNLPYDDNYYNNHNLNSMDIQDSKTALYYELTQSGNDNIHFTNSYHYDSSGTLYYLDSLSELPSTGTVKYLLFPFSNYLMDFGPTFSAGNVNYSL